MNRPTWGHPGAWAGWAALLALACGTGGSWAGQLSDGTFPPATVFRTLQLITLACGRENTAASCDKARSQADPLLDHPRLSASCKDILWSIRENARTASTNSLERRDRIDRAARDLTVFCRQPTLGSSKPGGSPAGSPGAPGGPGASAPGR